MNRLQVTIKHPTADMAGTLSFVDGGADAMAQKRWVIQPRSFVGPTEGDGYDTLIFKSDHHTTGPNAVPQFAIFAYINDNNLPGGVTQLGMLAADSVSGRVFAPPDNGAPSCSSWPCIA